MSGQLQGFWELGEISFYLAQQNQFPQLLD